MAFNLLETVKGFFTPDIISNTAASLGETETGIQKALSGSIPAILAGLVSKAGNTESATAIFDLAKQAAGSGCLNNLGGFLDNDNNNLISQGAEMLKGIFGDKAGGIASLVSNFAGVKHASASALLSVAASASLGVLGQHALTGNLDAGGLANFLLSQKNAILGALPSSLQSVASLPGLGANAHARSYDVHHAGGHDDHDTGEVKGIGSKFLVPFFLGLIAVAICIFLFKACTGKDKTAAEITIENPSSIQSAHANNTATVSIQHEMLKVKLPDGVILDAYKGGIEDKLVSFLQSDYKKLGADSLKKIWFDFDDLNFKTASAEITRESQHQVNNLAAILKAFPVVKLKIGGYTDKVGNEANNVKLSGERAKAVQSALAKTGTGNQVTSAEGYGSSFAVFPADAPETERIKDRHVSVSVRD